MAHNKESTVDDAWDDSELLSNWNAALEEYKKYHSMAARGEAVPVADLENLAASQKSTANETADSSEQNDVAANPPQASAGEASKQTIASHMAPPAFPSTVNGASLPSNLLGSQQDNDLKSLMMSWYYAGYYTGLYEGKQKAWVEMQEQS